MGLTVRTALGALEGEQRGAHQAFLGIPYAAPPTGERRFRAPQPAEKWEGVRDATRIAAAAPQGTHPVPGMAASGPRDEDCLYLNVFTPAADGGERPVLFWIHGGGFTLGSGSEALYNGGPLAERGDVVVVAIHYRLGALGYAYLGGHGGDEWGATANAGQLDQIAALEWVRDNIASFGGSPDNVTIFGESAGAGAVATLLAMPAGRGLFHRAVMQSGTAARVASTDAASQLAAALLDELGLTNAEELRTVSADAIVEAQGAAARKVEGATSWGIVCDSVTLPQPPHDAVSDGVASEVPIIVGTNRDEVKLFSVTSRDRPDIDDAALIEQVRASIPSHASEGAEALAEAYRASRQSLGLGALNIDILDAVQTDARFRLPALRLAEAQSAHQPNSFVYLFAHESPARGGVMGSCHALEMPFVFGTLDAPTQDRFAGTGPDVDRLSANMMDAWIAFAKTGNPSHEGIGRWQPYTSDQRPTMVFDAVSSLVDDPLGDERKAWERLPG